MGQVFKVNDHYYIEFYARGLLYSQVAGTNLEEAQSLLAQIESKIAAGEALTIARRIELADFFDRFLSDAKGQCGPQTIGRYSQTAGHIQGFLRQQFPLIHHLDQLTPSVIEAYKSYLTKSNKPCLVNFTLLLLKDILEFGIKLGFMNDNPTLHVRLLPWASRPLRRKSARWELAQKLLPKGTGLRKFAHLAGITDVGRVLYFANLIPLNREDMYN